MLLPTPNRRPWYPRLTAYPCRINGPPLERNRTLAVDDELLPGLYRMPGRRTARVVSHVDQRLFGEQLEVSYGGRFLVNESGKLPIPSIQEVLTGGSNRNRSRGGFRIASSRRSIPEVALTFLVLGDVVVDADHQCTVVVFDGLARTEPDCTSPSASIIRNSPS